MNVMGKGRPPGRARRRFSKEFKADAVALVSVSSREDIQCLTRSLAGALRQDCETCASTTPVESTSGGCTTTLDWCQC